MRLPWGSGRDGGLMNLHTVTSSQSVNTQRFADAIRPRSSKFQVHFSGYGIQLAHKASALVGRKLGRA